jgi:hypothetical protein
MCEITIVLRHKCCYTSQLQGDFYVKQSYYRRAKSQTESDFY